MAKDAVGYALTGLNKMASSNLLDRLGLRRLIERVAYSLTRTGFRVITTSARTFGNSKKLDKPERLTAPGHTTDLFDLNITDEQQMIRDSVKGFAQEVLRPRGEEADAAQRTSDETLAAALELGLNFFAVPESLGGAASERSPVTTMLVAEDLGWGDMGQAVAILSPMGVANALTQWGSADQQARYLPAFAGEAPPKAAIAVTEAQLMFDPMNLSTTAVRNGDNYVLNGTKAMVPLAAEAELFLVAAQTEDGPAVFIVEGGTEGLSAGEDPAMGVRASGQRPLILENVTVSAAQRLGADDFDYRAFIDLGTLAWCALAVGNCQAVLDYVVPYCNERKAFGEPISYRQAVAFLIADMAIEVDAMRMLVWRAVSRAEQGKDFKREAHIARTLCKEKAMKIGTDGVQLLGGHGFTHEYPVERWYRDLRAVGVMFSGLHL
ncbi:acyl-CoA dehydrogenase family protein [Alcanivorax sp. JB21]|uniref:acyl-CoA dehydrogenase family protein n=1 Tax=Alcanivorax limicola TaxID=2874102 RepID=UPI001CBD2C17|nr:acyl-CoA dehydrogenase family protein [Alcanivorax limicola]MBZ2188564.1 acyl-CoA dehydrogenase family protein [Alcanivorax limicola]